MHAHIFAAALAFLLTQERPSTPESGKGHLMTKARQHERQKRRQAEFVTDEEQRLLEIEDMRLVVKFGEKRRYSDRECEAIYEELVAAGLDDRPDACELFGQGPCAGGRFHGSGAGSTNFQRA